MKLPTWWLEVLMYLTEQKENLPFLKKAGKYQMYRVEQDEAGLKGKSRMLKQRDEIYNHDCSFAWNLWAVSTLWV